MDHPPPLVVETGASSAVVIAGKPDVGRRVNTVTERAEVPREGVRARDGRALAGYWRKGSGSLSGLLGTVYSARREQYTCVLFRQQGRCWSDRVDEGRLEPQDPGGKVTKRRARKLRERETCGVDAVDNRASRDCQFHPIEC